MSIQQSINSQVYKMADRAVTPEQIKSIQAHLIKGVQDGSVPSYVGIPLLNDLNQKMARIQTAPAQAQAMTQQPPIAQQVMSQAEQSGGVPTLPSGLPEQGMAGGGIVAFGEGGDIEEFNPIQARETVNAIRFGNKQQIGDKEIENMMLGLGMDQASLGINLSKMKQGDKENLAQNLVATYNTKFGDVGVDASAMRPLDARPGVYMGNLNASYPLGQGRVMAGTNVMRTPEETRTMANTLGYSGKVGPGYLNATIMQPKGFPQGRQYQLQYGIPFSEGGIASFARGGDLGLEADLIDEDEDLDFMDEMSKSMKSMQDIYSRMAEMEPAGIGSLAPEESKTFVTETPEGAAIERVAKRTGDGAVQIEHDKKAVQGDDLLQRVLARESGGRRYDKFGQLLTSPKGAEGEMQVMPGTQRDPGFGVEPARSRDPEEIARVGRDYLKALRERYGNDKLAMIAYNMGPGATDKWLASGADPGKLPAETRQYVAGMAGGGIAGIKHFQLGGLSAVDLMNSSLADVKRMAAMGEPGAAEELLRRLKNQGVGAPRMAGSPPMSPSAPVTTPGVAPAAAGEGAAAGEAAASRGLGALGRLSGAGAIGLTGYEIGKGMLERKQAEELAKYGAEPEPTQEELERAAKPAFYPSMSRKQQAQRGEKPLAPLTYTPAGVETYGSRPGYTPPSKTPFQRPVAGPGSASWGMDLGQDVVPNIAGPGEAGWGADIGEDTGISALAPKNVDEVAAAAKTPEGSSYLQKLRDRIEKGYQSLEDQKKTDAYMALLSAGLGMMGGTSPFAAANIGAGGLKGVQALQQAEATRAAQEKALMAAELGAERYAQYGELTKAQQEALAEYRKSETERKTKGAEAALLEKSEARKLREQQGYARQLEAIEKLAVTSKLAKEKGAFTPEDKERIGAQALDELRSDAGYRRLYKLVHGFDPVAAKTGNTISWDQLIK